MTSYRSIFLEVGVGGEGGWGQVNPIESGGRDISTTPRFLTPVRHIKTMEILYIQILIRKTPTKFTFPDSVTTLD